MNAGAWGGRASSARLSTPSPLVSSATKLDDSSEAHTALTAGFGGGGGDIVGAAATAAAGAADAVDAGASLDALPRPFRALACASTAHTRSRRKPIDGQARERIKVDESSRCPTEGQ